MKYGTLFEQPKIYLLFYLVLLFIYLMNLGFLKDDSIKNSIDVLFYLTSFSVAFYAFFKGKLRINTIHRNTPKAFMLAFVMVIIIFISSTIIGLIFGYAEKFMTANSIAMLGGISPLVIINNKFLTVLIIGFLISTIETITAINIYDLMLSSFKSNYTFRDPKVWVGAGVVGLGAIPYHLYAKYISITNALNIHALIIVFVLFSLSCLFAVGTKEMETSIYGHIINNLIALGNQLKFF